MRLNAYESTKICKQKIMAYHDKMIQKKNFQPGQYVLLNNSGFWIFPGKHKSKWFGPFMVKEVKQSRAMELINPATPDPEKTWIVNGQRLKICNGEDIERLTTVIRLQDP